MENASKALIIAGAILISILLIGLAVYVYQMASGAAERVNLNGPEAQAQNSQFTSYFGDKVSAADVKALMSQIRTNNITGANADEQKNVTVFYNGTQSTTTAVSQAVKPGKTYWVNAENENALTDDEEDKTLTLESPSYYSTGYLRIISIWEGKHGGSSGNSNP